MENKYNQSAQLKHPQTAWIVLIAVLITAIVVGAIVYILQIQKIDKLEEQVTTMNQVIGTLNNSLNSMAKINSTTSTKDDSISKTATSTKSSDLKIYKDGANKISFQYNDNNWDYYVQNISNQSSITVSLVLFLKEGVKPTTKATEGFANGNQIIFSISKMADIENDNLTEQQWLNEESKQIKSVDENAYITSEMINNKKFTKYVYGTSTMGKFIRYVYLKDDLAYEFSYWPYDPATNSQDINDLQTMLKTFAP